MIDMNSAIDITPAPLLRCFSFYADFDAAERHDAT